MTARTGVLYITGSGRSGTNVLGHILGQVEGFCFVGGAMYAAARCDMKPLLSRFSKGGWRTKVAREQLDLPFIGPRLENTRLTSAAAVDSDGVSFLRYGPLVSG